MIFHSPYERILVRCKVCRSRRHGLAQHEADEHGDTINVLVLCGGCGATYTEVERALCYDGGHVVSCAVGWSPHVGESARAIRRHVAHKWRSGKPRLAT